MSLISFQIFAATSIFLIALLAGLLPIKIMHRHEKALALGDAWASGVFFGVALFHMLPDAQNSFTTALKNPHYPYAALCCVLGFLLLLITERFVIHVTNAKQGNYLRVTGVLLFILLSIHSLIEGAAIGVNTIIKDALAIYLAVIAHKGSASFALAANLHRGQHSQKTSFWLIFLFSLMSPLGIIFSSLIIDLMQQQRDVILVAIFNAFAAGTFLYIGMRHILERQFAEYHHIDNISELIAIISGIIMMAIVAIWT